MTLDGLQRFLGEEWREMASALGLSPRAAGDPVDESAMAQRASEGAVARQFLESAVVQQFMAKAEAQVTQALVGLPLADDQGRLRLAVSIQTIRQLRQFLAASARDGISAERELLRLRKGDKRIF